jgi:hypothetical protein
MGDSERKANLRDAREADAALRRLDYQRRKEEGRCTRRGCKAMAAPDSGMCETCGPVQRARVRSADKTRRDAARDAGQCRDCGAKSDTCRCVDCQIRFGRVAKRTLARLIVDSERKANHPALVTTIERDGRYPSGRIRTRYRGGQGRRGAPSRAAIDAADVALALACLRRAHEKLEQLCNVADKRERTAARAEAMGQVALAGRMIDEVLDRSGVSDPP